MSKELNITFALVQRIWEETRVNVLGVTDWKQVNPKVWQILLNEYKRIKGEKIEQTNKIPVGYTSEVVKAINFFLLPSTQENGKEKKQTTTK